MITYVEWRNLLRGRALKLGRLRAQRRYELGLANPHGDWWVVTTFGRSAALRGLILRVDHRARSPLQSRTVRLWWRPSHSLFPSSPPDTVACLRDCDARGCRFFDPTSLGGGSRWYRQRDTVKSTHLRPSLTLLDRLLAYTVILPLAMAESSKLYFHRTFRSHADALERYTTRSGSACVGSSPGPRQFRS